MKKWIILCGALLAALLMLLYCTDVKFDNPLDKKGTNYLMGDTTDEADKIAENDDGVSGLFDPAINEQWSCDSKNPEFRLLGLKRLR